MTLSRRDFLHTSAAAIAAGASSTTLAGEPVVRSHGPKFKFSLAAYSYRDLLSGKDASLKLSDFVDDCAKFGLEGTELTAYYFPSTITTEYLIGLKAQCFRLGLDVSGTAVGNDFGVADPEKLKKQLESMRAWIDRANILGAPTIRVFAGTVPQGEDPAAAHKRMVAALEESAEYAGKAGIYLGLENHGGPTATPDGLLALVRDVKSPWLGVNLDSGNFHGEDVYAELEQVAKYAVNVQIKVVVNPKGKGRQPSDYKRLAKMLRDSGYRGYIVLEFEEKGDPRTECPKYLTEIKEAFAG